MKEIQPGQVLILNQKECRALFTDQETVALVEQVLADFSNGTAINPLKGHMPLYPDHYSYLNAMPSWLKKENIAGIKWAGMGEENPGKGLVQAMASIILNDTDTAYPIAYMDGTAIMAARTGAVAAIMGKLLRQEILQGHDGHRSRRTGDQRSGYVHDYYAAA